MSNVHTMYRRLTESLGISDVREVRVVVYAEVTVADEQLQELLDAELVSPLVGDVYFLETDPDVDNMPDWLNDLVLTADALGIEEIRISTQF